MQLDDIQFWSPFLGSNIDDFWYFVKIFLFVAAPALMIWIAIELLEDLMVTVMRSLFSKQKDKEDEDDVEVRYY